MLYPEQNEARLKLSLDGTCVCAGQLRGNPVRPCKAPAGRPAHRGTCQLQRPERPDHRPAPPLRLGVVSAQGHPARLLRRQRVVLRFGSVTHTAKVWLNGQLIAQHKGGFTPFEADVTALLQPGETALLTVACDNRVNHSTLPVGNEDGQLAFFGSDNAGIPSVEAAKRAAAPQNRPNFDFFNYAGIHRPGGALHHP